MVAASQGCPRPRPRRYLALVRRNGDPGLPRPPRTLWWQHPRQYLTNSSETDGGLAGISQHCPQRRTCQRPRCLIRDCGGGGPRWTSHKSGPREFGVPSLQDMERMRDWENGAHGLAASPAIMPPRPLFLLPLPSAAPLRLFSRPRPLPQPWPRLPLSRRSQLKGKLSHLIELSYI